MTTTADVVVVGAGVIGSSIALELARAGHAVHVVDAAAGPGLGSTSASSAIIRFNYSTYDGVALAWESLHAWRAWAEHLDSRGEQLARLLTTGLVMLDVPVAPREPVLALFDRVGVPYEQWDSAELARRVPGLDPTSFWPPKRVDDAEFWTPGSGALGAFFTPDAGFVDDPQLAAINLAAAAQRHGAQLSFGRRVVSVVRTAERVGGVELDDGTSLLAPVVVNAAGPWSAALNRLAGVGGEWSVSTRGMRQEVHHVAAPEGYGMTSQLGPVIADLDLGTYLRATPGGGLLVGGTEPECDGFDWVDDPDAVSLNPTLRLFTAQVTRAARRLTGLTVPGSPRGVVGVYDVSDDWAPIYDRTELAGYYVAIGTSGNQFKNAPVVGRLMAVLIDAVEAGHDHDHSPVLVTGPRTGLTINLGSFSRVRRHGPSTGTVLG